MAISFSMTFDASNALGAFPEVARALENPIGLMKMIDLKRKQQIMETFNTGTDPNTGSAWPRTKAFTLGLRPGGGGETLVATNRLFASIVSRAPQITPTSVTHGTNLPYGKAHQLGMKIMPKGKFLAIPVTRAAAKIASGRTKWVAQWFKKNPKGVWLRNKAGETYGFGFAAPKGGKPEVHGVLKEFVQLPPRPFLGMGELYAAEIVMVTERWLKMTIDQAAQGRGIA